MTDDTDAEPTSVDYFKALNHHASRSPKAQDLDETIQARDQIVDFEAWMMNDNRSDFPGVDDFNPFGRIAGGPVYDPTEEFGGCGCRHD